MACLEGMIRRHTVHYICLIILLAAFFPPSPGRCDGAADSVVSAAISGDFKKLKRLIDEGADVNER
ncbi:MAG: hypothetical protein V2B18_19925, partial [Pseudomonadota bacterium]